MVQTIILIVALAIAIFSVYWYLKLMLNPEKGKKEIWLALLCFWGAFLSIATVYVILMSKIGPEVKF